MGGKDIGNFEGNKGGNKAIVGGSEEREEEVEREC